MVVCSMLSEEPSWEGDACGILDKDAAQLMGIDINRTISYTFAIGSALAGAAGSWWVFTTIHQPIDGSGPGLKALSPPLSVGLVSFPVPSLAGSSWGLWRPW